MISNQRPQEGGSTRSLRYVQRYVQENLSVEAIVLPPASTIALSGPGVPRTPAPNLSGFTHFRLGPSFRVLPIFAPVFVWWPTLRTP